MTMYSRAMLAPTACEKMDFLVDTYSISSNISG